MTNLRKTILTAMAVITVASTGIAAIPSNAEAGFFDSIGGFNRADRFATSTGTVRSTVTFARPATQTQVGTVPSTIQFGNPATQTQFGTVPSTIIFGQ